MAKLRKIDKIEVGQLDSWLSSTGFSFPRNVTELDRFDKIYEDYEYKLDKFSIDPISIINNTFHKVPKVVEMFSSDVDEEIDSLRMVARKGNEDLPQHIIEKMRRKHNLDPSD